NFDYPAGDSVQMHGWITHSSYGLQPLVVSPGLTYTGYPSSGIGNACLLDSNMYEDVSKNFPEQTSGSVYSAFMVKIQYATTGGDYFYHIGPTTMGYTYRCRVFVKDDGSGNVLFGLRKGSSGNILYTTATYNYNTIYLLIAKYTFNPSADDDVVVMYIVSGTVPSTEPTTPDLGPSIDGSDLSDAGTVAMRNGSASSRPSLIIDGIRISTNWQGVTAIKNISTTSVSDFHLSQNYPNPFNPSTKINFSIPGNGSVFLKVYNSLGQEITNLVNEQLSRGLYEVEFDGSNLNSGVYFYTIQYMSIEGKYYTDTKKLLLIK
ncbi:MAG: T9SS type A sorting domain-containing protein, partial [Ignavibacteria bacterium]|nr:T9SS type A sorting domain-containing protein [Ignavibacteria bacterium]